MFVATFAFFAASRLEKLFLLSLENRDPSLALRMTPPPVHPVQKHFLPSVPAKPTGG